MKYKTIALQYIADIQSTKLAIGAKMPSLRQLAKQHAISMTTALNCYRYLEESSWIFARPQAGFFVSKPLTILNTPHLAVFKSSLFDGTEQVLDEALYVTPKGPLGLSHFAPTLHPTEGLYQSLRKATKRLGNRVHLYPAIQGETVLREALSSHFKSYHFHFSANELVITNGCLDAVRTALEVVTAPGDVVAISSPCFSGLINLLTSMHRKIIEIPSMHTGIDLEQLESLMKSGSIRAGLFSTSHMNPQGLSLSPEQKQSLAALAARYQIPIIEDDIYIELGHGKIMPLPAKHWDNAGYILWCGSVSKTLSAGYRVGWCLPGRFLTAYLKKRAIMSTGVCTPVQVALADFINTDQYSQHMRKMRHTLTLNTKAYREVIAQYALPDIRVSCPQGGMVLWLQLPKLDSKALLKKAKQQHIDIYIGAQFTTRSLYEDCVRINIGWPLDFSHTPHQSIKMQLHQLLDLMHDSVR